jgi:hypothetical protein
MRFVQKKSAPEKLLELMNGAAQRLVADLLPQLRR